MSSLNSFMDMYVYWIMVTCFTGKLKPWDGGFSWKIKIQTRVSVTFGCPNW